ncbi:hypothetical protein TREMEDRAFT_66940 [Tremella mesenterica DSM 1558]|uniref:uncharacterized protein n=1 Tax=Tremella mesenterica (strain ATCC 24925 / CBS 8224 / DSM 1558 / NBRC 9311 / NRRL Y-6157 / RJB 2259-6 / UBC 559-6) TaxID=578456 RepID=UPI0003F490ED|nr:uncharacterized protein TREMEDRAFT_66940 [Tremella mesenterica DSM 1558]EIW72549.1 hypothetical protein TREMEDRAFT_66940 [Tremella mesenterica DSM 1558]
MPKLEKKSSNRVSTGHLIKYSYLSPALGNLETSFNIFLPSPSSPPSTDSTRQNDIPVLFYLTGLTCTEDTGAQKGGILNTAGEENIAVVFPDTSPRGAGIKGEEDDWDFGTGAGFYLNATSEEWKEHYNMYELIVDELPKVLQEADLGLDLSRISLMGHSMGSHGALSIYLKNPGKYRSASAFAPVCNPSKTPWGIKAFSSYLSPSTNSDNSQEPPESWKSYDSSYLLSSSSAPNGSLHVLVDVGTADDFLKKGQLEPQTLEEATKNRQEGEVVVRMQEGFDHSYYFISTFTPEHVRWHAKFLKA